MKNNYNMPYKPIEKLKALNLLKKCSFDFVSRRYHCTIQTLYRWKRLYNGSLDSLENKSHRPKTAHPNSHNAFEIKCIKNLIKRNKHITLNELYGKLINFYNYNRNPASLYRYLKKNGFFINKTKVKKHINKPYDTPLNIGEKWQLDTKYIPFNCRTKNISGADNFYQYTVIDEASRKRFIFAYREIISTNTVDFLQRAFRFFGYKPKIIQTDNGSEFTYSCQCKKMHLLDRFCKYYNIEHKLIKPRTPRHNGKVERSHRNDNERFYKWLKFYSFEDLQKQMRIYLLRSNNIPNSCLSSFDGLKKWLSPNQKENELISLIKKNN